MLIASNRSTTAKCEICSKLTIKTPINFAYRFGENVLTNYLVKFIET